MRGLRGRAFPAAVSDGAPSSWRALRARFATLAVGESIASLFGLLAIVLLARRLGPDGFGLFALGTTLVAWFALVVDSGTEFLNIRDISRRPDRFREIAEPVLGLRLALAAPAAIVMVVITLVVPATESDRHVLWLFALVLPVIAVNPRWMVLGIGASKPVAAGNVLRQVVLVTGTVLFVEGAHDVAVAPVLQIVAELAYGVVILITVGLRIGWIRPRVDIAKWRSTLVQSLPLMGNQFARAVVYSADLFLVAAFVGGKAVGYYGGAAKPVLFLSGVLSLLNVSFLTSFSAGGSREQSQALFRTAIRSAAAITAAVATIGAILSPVIVTVLYGQSYAPAATALTILILSTPVLALTGIYSMTLIAADQQRVLMRNNWCGAAFNVAANLVVIPLAGIEGAAAVTVVAELLNLALNSRSAASRGLAPPLLEVLSPRGRSTSPPEAPR